MRIGMGAKMGGDLVSGPNGGTLRRRRELRPFEVEGVDWVCARAVGGREFRVADELAAAGFRIFAPHGVRVCERARLDGGRRGRRERDYPVFGVYLFVGQPPGRTVTRRSHPQLTDILANPGGSTCVPAAFIRAAAELWLDGAWDARVFKPDASPFRPGAAAWVKRGPLQYFRAIVESLPSELQAIVLVTIFGRPCRVRIDTGALDLA